jgi:hypothetical protein
MRATAGHGRCGRFLVFRACAAGALSKSLHVCPSLSRQSFANFWKFPYSGSLCAVLLRSVVYGVAVLLNGSPNQCDGRASQDYGEDDPKPLFHAMGLRNTQALDAPGSAECCSSLDYASAAACGTCLSFTGLAAFSGSAAVGPQENCRACRTPRIPLLHRSRAPERWLATPSGSPARWRGSLHVSSTWCRYPDDAKRHQPKGHRCAANHNRSLRRPRPSEKRRRPATTG